MMAVARIEQNSAQAVMSRFLLNAVDPPNSKSDKAELWKWINQTVVEMRTIRRTFLNNAAAKMVKADNPLYDALEHLLLAMEQANPEWWRNVGALSVTGDPVAQAWEKLNNVRNGMK